MGAKKWATTLVEKYQKTGRFLTSGTQEDEIEDMMKSGFNTPFELIHWAGERHYTLKKFYFIYCRQIQTTNFLRDAVRDMFIARYAFIDLYKFFTYELINTYSNQIAFRKGFLEFVMNKIVEESDSFRYNKIIEFSTYVLTIASLKDHLFRNDEIKDLICFINYNDKAKIVNNRANLRLIRVFKFPRHSS